MRPESSDRAELAHVARRAASTDPSRCRAVSIPWQPSIRRPPSIAWRRVGWIVLLCSCTGGSAWAQGDIEAARTRVDLLKLGLAIAGTALLVWGALARSATSELGPRIRDGLLVSVAVLSAAAWWNFFEFHHAPPNHPVPRVHVWDFFHYYMGAKYFDELGYFELYACANAADLESPRPRSAKKRVLRDLRTAELIPASSLDPEACKARFSAERWQSFKADAWWFRSRMAGWNQLLRDWGFNATPVWTASGQLLTRFPATDQSISRLALLEFPTLLVAFAAFGWAFGWQGTCVAIIFWGTNFPGQYSWTGGSLLRHEWFALLLFGVGALKRGWLFTGGFLLSAGALFRIVPGLAFLGLGWLGILRLVGSDPEARRRTFITAGGALAAIAVLVPWAGFRTGGLEAWTEFAANSAVDTAPSGNNLGWKSAVAYRAADSWAAIHRADAPGGDSDGTLAVWETARTETLASRRPLYVGGIAAGLLLLGAAIRRMRAEDWSAAVLGIGAVPIAFDLSSYYHVCIAVFAGLATRQPWIGVGLCALAAASQAIRLVVPFEDERYMWLSLTWIAFVLGAAASFLLTTPREPVAEADGP